MQYATRRTISSNKLNKNTDQIKVWVLDLFALILTCHLLFSSSHCLYQNKTKKWEHKKITIDEFRVHAWKWRVNRTCYVCILLRVLLYCHCHSRSRFAMHNKNRNGRKKIIWIQAFGTAQQLQKKDTCIPKRWIGATAGWSRITHKEKANATLRTSNRRPDEFKTWKRLFFYFISSFFSFKCMQIIIIIDICLNRMATSLWNVNNIIIIYMCLKALI